MNIIIVGVGKVGQYLAGELSGEDHNVLAIDYNPDHLNQTLTEFDISGVVGDATDYATLSEADVEHCDFFIAVTFEDDANIVAAIMAKRMGAKYTIARVRKPSYIDHRDFMQSTMGVDLLIKPEYEASLEIIRTLQYPQALNVEVFFNGLVEMIQIEVPDQSALGGRRLQDLDQASVLRDNLITMVQREGQIIIPNGDFVIQAGDFIYLAGRKKSLIAFCRDLYGSLNAIHSVVMIGADRISFSLAKLLVNQGMEVKMIEKNRSKAEDFQALHPKVDVICADGTAPSVLTEEHIGEYDAFLALTNIDEENIILSLLAAEFGINKRIAKVNRTELIRMTHILDIDTTIASKRSIANLILREVRAKANLAGSTSSKVNHVYRLEDNRVEALDFTIGENSKLINKNLNDLPIKQGILIAYILRDHRIYIPRGHDQLQTGDRVIVISSHLHLSKADDILEA